MINLSKSGNTIVFEFVNNGHYLQNGTIEVPVNSLTLVTDGSDMFTFKKSATNDIFVSGLYSEIGMTKSELETFYKENMVGSTGGSGGVTSGEVQSMIDESISGKADTSAVTEDISAAVSGKADTTYVDQSVSGKLDTSTFETYSGGVETTLLGKADASAVTQSINEAVSGKVDTSAFTAYSATVETALSGKQDTLSAGTNITISGNVISAEGGSITVDTALDSGSTNPVENRVIYNKIDDIEDRIAEDEEVTSAALNALNEEISGKVETSAFTTALSGKQDTLVSGTNIKTINNESLLGSGNIDIQGGGATYSGGSGINIDSANTITAVYDGWHGERVHNLDNISAPFYLYRADDCGWGSDFYVFFEINGAQSQVNFDVLTHTYVLVEGDSSWEDYVTVEWDASGCFKATPNTTISVSDASCARFSKLYFSGTTENAINGALDRIESINNSAIGNIEFGTRDSYNDLYLYPSTLNGGYINMSTVGLEGGLKVIGSNISTQMQSTPYKWMSGVTIGDSETSTFNAPSSAVTFNISRNPSEYLYAIDVNGNGYVFLDSNGDNPDPSNYSVVIVNGSVTVSALSTDKYITKITDSQGELSQYVSDVQYWGYEVDTIPNVVTSINEKFDGLRLKKLTQNEYDALVSGGTVDNNTLYVIS